MQAVDTHTLLLSGLYSNSAFIIHNVIIVAVTLVFFYVVVSLYFACIFAAFMRNELHIKFPESLDQIQSMD